MPTTLASDLLIPRSEVEGAIGGSCFNVVDSGNAKVEVCAPSRKEAHLKLQEVLKDGLEHAHEVTELFTFQAESRLFSAQARATWKGMKSSPT